MINSAVSAVISLNNLFRFNTKIYVKTKKNQSLKRVIGFLASCIDLDVDTKQFDKL